MPIPLRSLMILAFSAADHLVCFLAGELVDELSNGGKGRLLEVHASLDVNPDPALCEMLPWLDS